MDDKKVFRKNPNMVTRVIGDDTVLVPVYKSSDEISCIYTFNKPAGRVWELFDGKRSVEDVKKLILKEFDTTDSDMEKRMGLMLKDLREIKALL